MSLWERDNEEENEENEADEDEEFRNQTDRMIFLIDARESMLQSNKKGETQLQNCLSVVLEVIKTKIISQDASTIGVIFFGCRAGDEGEAPGVYTLFPISTPSAKNIRLLQTMIEDVGEFERLVGCQSTSVALCPLKQALWRCKLSFGTKDLKKTDYKRVWIFTNDDMPNVIYPEEQNKVVQIAKDCADGGIEISLWHCNATPHRQFQPNLFYSRLLKSSIISDADEEKDKQDMDEDDIEENINNRMMAGGSEGFDASVASVRRKQFRKRRMGQLLFAFSDRPLQGTPSIAVKSVNGDMSQHTDTEEVTPLMCVRMYKTVQIMKKPLHTWISMKSNEPIMTATRYLDAQSGAIVASDRIETFIDVQGTAVPFTSEDIMIIKRRDPWTNFQPYLLDKKDPLKAKIPGIRLLCCIPRAHLPSHLTVSTPYFLFPGESTIKGSAALFECFLRELLKKDLVAIVRFTRNLSTGKPVPAVLIPQAERVIDGVQMDPPGLQCIPLPFIEDIRFNPQSENLMSEVIRTDPSVQPNTGALGKLMMEYTQQLLQDGHPNSESEEASSFHYTTDIDNPSLQLFYALLQAIALNEELLAWKPDEHDTLRPSKQLLSSPSFARLMSQISEELGLNALDREEDVDEIPKSTGRKRPAASTATATSRAKPSTAKERKKAKDDDDDNNFAVDDDDDEDVKKKPATKRKRTVV